MPGPGSRYEGQPYFTPTERHEYKAGEVVAFDDKRCRKRGKAYPMLHGVVVGVSTPAGKPAGHSRWSKYWVLLGENEVLPILGYFLLKTTDTPMPTKCGNWEEFVRPVDYEPSPVKISRKEENKLLQKLERWGFEIDWADSDYCVPLAKHKSHRDEKIQLIASSTMALVASRKKWHDIFITKEVPPADKFMIFRITHKKVFQSFHLENQVYYVGVFVSYISTDGRAYWCSTDGDLKSVVQVMTERMIIHERVEELTLKLGGELKTLDALLL